MKNYQLNKTKNHLLLLILIVPAFLASCTSPIPKEYNNRTNYDKFAEYTTEQKISFLQCDGISNFSVIVGPGDSCIIRPSIYDCDLVVKRERFLSNGNLDNNPINIGIDTLSGYNDNNTPLTSFQQTDGTPYRYAILCSTNEYFKITINCVDMTDGKCEPRLRLTRN